ncbi:carbohydrate porin, partial [Leclercia sp.]
MRIHYIALLISASIPATTLAATQTDSMEAKIARLEASLAKAEAQIARLAQAQQTPAVNVVSAEPPTSPAPTLTLSGYGDLRFYGDVEFNMDAASRSGSLTSMRTSANKDWAPSNNERWDINGRLLLGFDGYRRMDNGQFAGFSAQPLADLTGKMNLDDAVFFFGQENDWKI